MLPRKSITNCSSSVLAGQSKTTLVCICSSNLKSIVASQLLKMNLHILVMKKATGKTETIFSCLKKYTYTLPQVVYLVMLIYSAIQI